MPHCGPSTAVESSVVGERGGRYGRSLTWGVTEGVLAIDSKGPLGSQCTCRYLSGGNLFQH